MSGRTDGARFLQGLGKSFRVRRMQSWRRGREAESVRASLQQAATVTSKDTRTNTSPRPGLYFVQVFQQFAARFEEGLPGQVIVGRTVYKQKDLVSSRTRTK